LTTTTVIDWNAWRASYGEMTFADQARFYDVVHDQFPEQARFSTRILERFLEHVGVDRIDVAELGGWDGGFAAEILSTHPEIASWVNHEASAAAVDASICSDPRYTGDALEDWYWVRHHVCDLFVASHVLEHLTFVDVLRVFDATHCKWMYLQSPLGEEATSWDGYRGSHILEVGWRVLVDELAERGFTFLEDISHPWARCFEAR